MCCRVCHGSAQRVGTKHANSQPANEHACYAKEKHNREIKIDGDDGCTAVIPSFWEGIGGVFLGGGLRGSYTAKAARKMEENFFLGGVYAIFLGGGDEMETTYSLFTVRVSHFVTISKL